MLHENNNSDELDFLNNENISLDVNDIPDFSNIIEDLNVQLKMTI